MGKLERKAPGRYSDGSCDGHRNLAANLMETTDVAAFRSGDRKDSAKNQVRLADSEAAIDALLSDDLIEVQRMLAAQAIACDQTFHALLRAASNKLSSPTRLNPDESQIHALFKIAFLSQERSRKSLEAIADIRRPRKATFVKNQQNILAMNGENGHAQGMERRIEGEAAPFDIGAETVGEIDWPPNGVRQGQIFTER